MKKIILSLLLASSLAYAQDDTTVAPGDVITTDSTTKSDITSITLSFFTGIRTR